MILVTGGAGYIGSHFVKTYLETHPEQDIVVVDNLSEGHREALVFSDRVHFFQEDIGHIDTMANILRQFKVEAIVHFAAYCYVGESQLNPSRYFQNNVIHSLNLFQAMELTKVKRIVFSSTCATYGNPVHLPLDEAHPQNPINIYGLTKLMVEQALRGYCETRGWHAMALRYFNAAGADASGLIGELHQPETHLIPLVLNAAKGEHPAIQILGDDYDTPDGTCVRDYIHVTDLAHAHIKALNYIAHTPGFEAVNLGTTQGASVRQIIAGCEQVTGKTIPVNITDRRPGDPASLIANADKAKKLLGWETKNDLLTILKTAWQWEQSNRFE